MPTHDDIFGHSTYTVRKKVLKLFGGAFHIYGPEGQLVLYSKLKAFKLKEDIRVFTDESMATQVLSIQARKILDFASAYDVTDARNGKKVGAVRRRGFKSMLRDEWSLHDPADREIGVIREDSLTLALVRRFVEAASMLFPQKYHGEVGGETVCSFRQNFNPFVMKITLDFSPDANGRLDRRLGMAAAILLCAIEGKQN